jgi:tetratricopeptide (TPR) repeat protein
MNPRSIGLMAVFALAAPPLFAQLPPLGSQPASPTSQPGTLPPPGGSPGAPAPKPAGSLSVDAANADLKAARAANQEKRFADAETLMLKDTSAKPDLPYLWIELGLAQLGEKKYDEAEVSFKAALTGGDAAQKKAPEGGFYVEGKGTSAHQSVTSSAPPPAAKNKPEIEGISLSSLGEVYIRTNRIPEAQSAFDKAAAANPSQAGFFYGNEAVFLFQVGNAPAQLEAANKAIAADPTRARNYYLKAQALTTQAQVDPKTSKLILPPGCLEAYQKYLALEPNGQFAPDTKAVLAAAQTSH